MFDFLGSLLILRRAQTTFGNSTKGQLISKCPFGVFNSSKKGTKSIRHEVSYTLCPEGAENIPLGSQVSDLYF